MEEVNLHKPQEFSFYLHKEKLLRQRIYAFSIDLFAILALNKIMTLTYLAYLRQFAWPMYRTFSDGHQLIQEAEIITLLILYTNYFLVSIFLSQGKTLGKTLIGLRVVGEENLGQISFRQSFMRSLGYTLCYIGGLVLFVLPFLNRRTNRGIPDWLSHTHVISEKQWHQVIDFYHQQQRSQQKKNWSEEINISGQSHEDNIEELA